MDTLLSNDRHDHQRQPEVCLIPITFLTCWHQISTFISTDRFSDANVLISAKTEWQYGEDWEINDNCHNGSFFPLHSACLSLLQKYTQYQSSVGSLQPPTTIKNFVDAFNARLEYSSKIHSAAWLSGQQAKLPPSYPWYGTVEWSHLYFGARRFWADPWDCESGMEFLCADPLQEPQTQQFLLTWFAYPQSNLQVPSLPSSHLQSSGILPNASPLIRCPREILMLIFHLPLRSALHLSATSRTLSSRLPPTDTLFWRSHTLHLHSPWFWELHSLRISSADSNWKALLQSLTRTRREILAEAKPYWYYKNSTINEHGKNANKIDEHVEDTAPSLPLLPLGLKNRQRIWMCLECVGMDGSQRKLAGVPDEETIEQIRNGRWNEYSSKRSKE